jgi:molybdopterin molybdotransferase
VLDIRQRSSMGEGVECLTACIRLEDVTPLPSVYPEGARFIQIKNPVLPNSHRRHTGGDFAKNDLVVQKGRALQPQHVTAPGVVRNQRDCSIPKIENRDLSKREELMSLSAVMKEHLVRDANGPFLETAPRNLGVEAQFWGVIGDDGGSS